MVKLITNIMPRVIFLLIPIIALVSGQNNETVTNATVSTSTITTTLPTNITTPISTTKPENGTTAEPTTKTTTTPTTTPTTAGPTVPPTPSPEEWSGNVTVDGGNNTCINVKFDVRIEIKYKNKNGSDILTGFIIPKNATVDQKKSSCSSNSSQTEAIAIDFVDEYTSGSLTLVFNSTEEGVFVQDIDLWYNLTTALFPLYNDTKQYNTLVNVRNSNNLKLFEVAKQHSYTCNDAQTALLEGDSLPNATISFTSSKVQAYIDKTRHGVFDSEVNCATTKISDVVPIAVGAALAGLVIIVLVAYFIGRRRSRRLAYQSV